MDSWGMLGRNGFVFQERAGERVPKRQCLLRCLYYRRTAPAHSLLTQPPSSALAGTVRDGSRFQLVLYAHVLG